MGHYNAFYFSYVPNVVKNEAVNFGVMLLGEDGFADVRFTNTWARVHCLDPDADIEMLSALEADIRARLNRSTEDHAAILKQMQQASNAVRISDPKPCITDSPDDELRRLEQLYVDGPRPRRELAGRQLVKKKMRKAFTEAGVWEAMMKPIPVAPYTSVGDPLKIDCGYKANGLLRLFHAHVLDSQVRESKALAFSYSKFAVGIGREHGATSELTAVVRENFNLADGVACSAFDILHEQNILVATTADLPELAARARIELKV